MPLHPIGIAVLGTLAVVGAGVAVKKFVYDPHVAPLVEAILAQRARSSQRVPVPGPVPAAIPMPARGRARGAAGASERKGHSHNGKDDGESWTSDRVAVARATGRDAGEGGLGAEGGGLRLRRRSAKDNEMGGEGERGVEMVDRDRAGAPHARHRFSDDTMTSPTGPHARYAHGAALSTTEHENGNALIDLDQGLGLDHSSPFSDAHAVPSISRRSTHAYNPAPAQARAHAHAHASAEAEIRSVIFNQPTPSPSGHSTPLTPYGYAYDDLFRTGTGTGPGAAPSRPHSRRASNEFLSPFAPATLRPSTLIPPLQPPQQQGHDSVFGGVGGGVEPSTTFSFLSLSQASSPEVPTSMLGSWHVSPRRSAPRSPPSGPGGDELLDSVHSAFAALHAADDHDRHRDYGHVDAHAPAHAHDLSRSVPDMRTANPPSGSRHVGASRERGADPDDVLSLPDTASSYADAESYTPNTSGALSPTYPAFPNPNPPPHADYGHHPAMPSRFTSGGSAFGAVEAGAGAGAGQGEGRTSELGLTFVRSPPRAAQGTLAALRASELEQQGQAVRASIGSGGGPEADGAVRGGGGRGPMSVISVSDSEADRSEWEAV